jgi:putative PIN family toxin of toxin-antitoxin system
MKPAQIVIDTNVVIAAQRSRRGASAKLMSLIGTGLFEIHVSVPLVLEFEEVLLRQRASLGLTHEDVTRLVDALCALAHHQEIHDLWRPYLRDAGDELVLELAVAAEFDYIVTYNKSDFWGTERFGIEVINPKALLERTGEMK